MPIYSINEKVSYFKPVTTTYGYKYSYYSGNMFESLASTNPELFETKKLEQISQSKNIVREFNDYVFDAIVNDLDRLAAFTDKNLNNKDYDKLFANEFNLSIHTLIVNDIRELDKEGIPMDKIFGIIASNYLPEGLSEEGAKRLIRIRLLNNQLLINSLLKMLEDNYTLLNISTIEAEKLKKGLNSDQSGKTIGEIIRIMKNPKTLKSFKDGSNYDFRSIGGAYMFISHGLEDEGAHPSKYLSYMFKYDAIVVTHGFETPRSRLNNPVSAFILNTNKNTVHDIMAIIKAYSNAQYYKKNYKDLCKRSKIIYDKLETVYESPNISRSVLQSIGKDVSDFMDYLVDLYNETNDDAIYDYHIKLDFMYQGIYSKEHIGQNMIDGKSSDWTIRPVNTLRKKNLTHVIDVVRALKDEGFKNVMLIVCNPGSIRLPLDIKLDPSFNVTMGTYSVLKEASFIHEGIIQDISKAISDIPSYIKDMITEYNKFLVNIKDKCKLMLKRAQNAFKISMDINVIELDNGKAKFKSIACKDQAQVERIISNANKSIENKIKELMIDSNKLASMTNRFYRESSIFDNIDLL